ncbi:MAG: hypothetical protein P8R42_13750 [Candidatus Binatia bacterium]|nr:hypothetical protein [Candidatus Binatia bacterium]
MNRTIVAIGCAVALFATSAQAGTYLGGAPLPAEFGFIGLIPFDAETFDATNKHQKFSSKLAASMAKCFSKGARNVSKGKDSGLDACLNDPRKGVVPKYLARVDALAPRPWCMPNGSSYVQKVLAFTRDINRDYYCESPSGAFLDPIVF